jgi:hypothetical protein
LTSRDQTGNNRAWTAAIRPLPLRWVRIRATPFSCTPSRDHAFRVLGVLNDKKVGMPTSTERPMPRIVDGMDLMAALRQSIEAEVKQRLRNQAATPKGKAAAKRNPAQREILLPIAGGAPDKGAPTKQEQKPAARKKAG